MSKPIIKVTALEDNGNLLKGMSVNIVSPRNEAKLTRQEIADALNQQFNANIKPDECRLDLFKIEETD